jgi:hypothetical protein
MGKALEDCMKSDDTLIINIEKEKLTRGRIVSTQLLANFATSW